MNDRAFFQPMAHRYLTSAPVLFQPIVHRCLTSAVGRIGDADVDFLLNLIIFEANVSQRFVVHVIA